MNGQNKNKFINKKLSISMGDKNFSDPPKIIRSSDLKEIHKVNNIISESKADLENEKKKEREEIEILKSNVERKAKEEITNKALEYFSEFEYYRDQYFNNIEEHCMAVVKKAIVTLLNDVRDEKRVRLALKSAIKEVKEKSDIVLKVNPEHELSIADFVSSRGWEVQFDSDFCLDECQIDIPLGGYRSSFNYSLDLIIGAINEVSFPVDVK